MNQQLDAAMFADLKEQQAKALQSNDGNVVGRVFHESLLRSLLRKSQPEGTAFGVTNKRIMSASLNYEEHEERREAAREAGRYFACTAVEAGEELLFIGATSVGINRDDNSEVAFTFIQDLQPMHSVDSEDEFLPAFHESKVRMFLDELSEAGAITVVNDGDICVSQDEFKAMPEGQREGFTTASNALLLEMFVGSSYSIAYCRNQAEQIAAS